jgi:hypothetical protein
MNNELTHKAHDINVADPRSVMGKKSRSGSGMNILNHISLSLENGNISKVNNTLIL